MTIRCVTTTNRAGWDQFGRKMAETFVKFWPSEIKLTIYAEDFEPNVEGIEVRQMPPWLARWKEANNDQRWKAGNTHRGYDFRFDAIKFSHKVAAIGDFMQPHRDGIDIWVDADTFTHSPVSMEFIEGLIPANSYMAWLERNNSFPECGFVMYRCDNPYHGEFIAKFADLYRSNDVFTLPEYHDSYVLQKMVLSAVTAKKMPHPASLSGDQGWSHPFVNGPLGSVMDHMKGPNRKVIGRSLPTDFRNGRNEPHWKNK